MHSLVFSREKKPRRFSNGGILDQQGKGHRSPPPPSPGGTDGTESRFRAVGGADVAREWSSPAAVDGLVIVEDGQFDDVIDVGEPTTGAVVVAGDGQFDDAVELLQLPTPLTTAAAAAATATAITFSGAKVQVAVVALNPHHYHHPIVHCTEPALNPPMPPPPPRFALTNEIMTQQPPVTLVKTWMPNIALPQQHQQQAREQQTSRFFPWALLLQQPSMPQASATQLLPIAPRPLHWKPQPIFSTIRMAPPKRTSTSRCRSRETSLPRQTVAGPPPRRQNNRVLPPPPAAAVVAPQMSPFVKLIRSHPSDRLIPSSSDTHRVDRLPGLPDVKRDANKERPVAHPYLTIRDVLLGRGALASRHSGNRWFRSLVDKYRGAYSLSLKGEKRQLARNLCTYVRLMGGRFLEKDGNKNERTNKGEMCWYECGDLQAQAKCSQALREGASTTGIPSASISSGAKTATSQTLHQPCHSGERSSLSESTSLRHSNGGNQKRKASDADTAPPIRDKRNCN